MLGQTIALLIENHQRPKPRPPQHQGDDARDRQVSELLSLLERHNDAVVIFDAAHTVHYINDTANNLFEDGIHEVVRIAHTISQQFEPMGLTTFEPNGESPIWLDIQCMQTAWAGKPVIIAFIRDVTQRRKLEEDLYKARRMEGLGSLAVGYRP
ncbi:MAG: hypothetical protein ACI9TH_000826 [Kiritimatiellia bacterium]